MRETLTASWCRRLGEAIALRGGRCLRRKELVCEGCTFNSEGWKKKFKQRKSGLR
ncbi:MAG: hypothetical protein QXE29_05675 [Candidatus Hadarchaeales archaeon]